MQFNERPFADRMSAMGDEAEQAFEAVWPNAYERYGFNRPKPSMKRWSLRVRYTPDFIDASGLIECQGFGRDRLLKIKEEKARALRLWAQDDRLRFFIWDRTKQRWTCVDWQVIDTMSMTPYSEGVYHEGKPFVALHFDQLANLPWNDKET